MSVPNFNEINNNFNNPLEIPVDQNKRNSIIIDNPPPPPNHMPENPRQIGDNADKARGGVQKALAKLVEVCRQVPMKWVKMMALGGIATGAGVIILIISASILGTGGAAVGALALFGLFGSLLVLAAGVSVLTYGATRGLYDAMTGEGQYEEHHRHDYQREIPQMRDLPPINQANQGQNPGPIPIQNQDLRAAQGINPSGPGAGAGQLEREENRNDLADRNIQQLPNDQSVPLPVPQPQPQSADDLFDELLNDVSRNPHANPQIQHLSQEILSQQQHLQDRRDQGPNYQAHRPKLDPVFLDSQNIIQISEEIEEPEAWIEEILETNIENTEEEPRIVEIIEEEVENKVQINESPTPNIEKPALVLNSSGLLNHLQTLNQNKLELIMHTLLQSYNSDYKERVKEKFIDRQNELDELNKIQIQFKKDNKKMSLGLIDYFGQLNDNERKNLHNKVKKIYGTRKQKT